MIQHERATVFKSVTAVNNTGSGGSDPGSGERMREIFAAAGLSHAVVIDAAPETVEKALADAAASAGVVVVLGGDGTVRTAAIACGRAEKFLIALPGGTMNMLPHALYGNISWEAALADTLAAPSVRDVSGGMVEGQAFFCAAVLGAPSLWADAREALRRGHPIEAIRRSATALRRASDALEYRFDDGARGSAEAVVVLCPLVSRAMVADDLFLEAAAVAPVTASGMFSLAFHAVFDDWRRDPAVSLTQVKTARISGHGRVPVILDGERATMGRTVRVTFSPLAFRALVPAERAA